MPYCPFCGSEVSEGDTFCQSCGAVLGPVPNSPQRPRKDRTRMYVAIFIAAFLLITAVGAVFIATVGNEFINGDLKKTYRWDYEGKSFTYSMDVKRADFNEMMSSDIDRTGSVSTDQYKTTSGTVEGVCDYIVVDSYITAISDMLKQEYQKAFGSAPTNDEYVKFASAFVQICIDYDHSEANSGEEYWRYPLETLVDGIGDCEDTSILLAALIDAGGLNGGVILVPGHAMCAVYSSDLSSAYANIRHSDVYDANFYPIETTVDTFRTIGEISDDYLIVYHHLYTGHSTVYFNS
jgi:hypothetical protein